MNKNLKSGFTLIELSVVIIVIGILIGGILTAQNMIENSKNQTIIKELADFSSAMNNFYMKYNALPGDISNASSYWSSATNGDNDGKICCYNTESVYIWNHLMQAGMIKGNFDGTYADLLDSVPESRSSRGYYKAHAATMADDNWDLNSNEIYDQGGNFIGIGSQSTSGDYANGAVTGKQAESIDQKMDDGNASAGKLVAIKGTDNLSTAQSGCVSASTFDSSAAGTISYDTSSGLSSCRLIFFMKELSL